MSTTDQVKIREICHTKGS